MHVDVPVTEIIAVVNNLNFKTDIHIIEHFEHTCIMPTINVKLMAKVSLRLTSSGDIVSLLGTLSSVTLVVSGLDVVRSDL